MGPSNISGKKGLQAECRTTDAGLLKAICVLNVILTLLLLDSADPPHTKNSYISRFACPVPHIAAESSHKCV